MSRYIWILSFAALYTLASCAKKEETETTVTTDSTSVTEETQPVTPEVPDTAATAVAGDSLKSASNDLALAGKKIFYNTGYGNVRVACADCHSDGSPGTKDAKLRTGHTLAGVTKRTSTWNGEFKGADLPPYAYGATLCAKLYQQKPTVPSKDIESLNAYLTSIESAPGAVQKNIPVQWVTKPELKPGDAVDSKALKTATKAILRMPGDAGKGAAVFARTCTYCHGLKEAKAGPALENGFADVEYAVRTIRAGSGAMPFYATNVLTDQQIADLIAYIQENLAK